MPGPKERMPGLYRNKGKAYQSRSRASRNQRKTVRSVTPKLFPRNPERLLKYITCLQLCPHCAHQECVVRGMSTLY